MKSEPIRRFDVDNPVAPGVIREQSNKTKISSSAAFVYLNCPVCEIEFERKASEAKRHNISYCGRGCQGIASRDQVIKSCAVCEKRFSVKRSMSSSITCCGNQCKSALQSQRLAAKNKVVRYIGSESGGSKLTEQEAISILVDSRTHTKIAADYGVTRSAVSALKRGDTWRHLIAK